MFSTVDEANKIWILSDAVEVIHTFLRVASGYLSTIIIVTTIFNSLSLLVL